MSDRQNNDLKLIMQQEQLKPQKKLDLEEIIYYPTWREMLYDMIYQEDIDPWNIDIEKITAKYIEKVKEMQLLDLRIPANLVLAAAILLRIKTFRFLEYEQQTTLDDFSEHLSYEQIQTIELKGRLPPKGRITLQELIKSIEEVMEQTKRREEKISQKELQEFMPLMEIKLNEFRVDKEMERIYQKIVSLADSYNLVMFSALLDSKTRKSIIYTLIPILFLAQKEKISIVQETFFGDIFIRLTDKNK
ncbi:MAG: segregation/condensation protein A [Candidatus Anstonellaceae archaeon]